MKVTKGEFDPTASGYKKAVKVCGPILQQVGITFPNPAGTSAKPSLNSAGESV
ncbi:hypothetical protein [Streptomyces sp. NPDC001980]|uniref:hypothetical protein n=1 Tax=Streptomyces sp. NPDC001980 TaxID=3157126 RepID=UPI003318286E